MLIGKDSSHSFYSYGCCSVFCGITAQDRFDLEAFHSDSRSRLSWFTVPSNYSFSGIRAQDVPFQEAFHSSRKGTSRFALPFDASAFRSQLSARRFEGVSISVPDQPVLPDYLIWMPQNPLIAGRHLTYRASVTRSPGFEPDRFYDVVSGWKVRF